MINTLFPKVTEIEGGAAKVTTPEFSLSQTGAIVFLIGASDTPLKLTAKGYRGENIEKALTESFRHTSILPRTWRLGKYR